MNFSVPEPCNEDWNGMSPQGNGRYCGSCQKVVVDFTSKTNEEILEHIKANAGKTCGTFKSSQLPPSDPYRQNERSIRFLAAVLLAFGLTLFSCSSIDLGDKGSDDPYEPTITGALSPPHELTGVIVCHNDSLPQGIPAHNYRGKLVASDKKEEITTGVSIIIPDKHDTIKVRKPENTVFGIVEQMPEYNGNMFQYIQNTLIYPQVAIDSSIQGIVYVTFVVKKDGSIEDAKILKGISVECDAEALRVVKSMPRWIPGKNKGTIVNVQMNLPIRFRLK